MRLAQAIRQSRKPANKKSRGKEKKVPPFGGGMESTARDIQVEEVFVEIGLAAIDESLNILTVVDEEEQKRQRAAEILPVLNVEIGAAVNVEFSGKFHLRKVLVDAGFVETVAEMGTKFTEARIIFGKSHGVYSSLSLESCRF